MTAAHAPEALLAALPAMLRASAAEPGYPLCLKVRFPLAPAALSVGELPQKVEKSPVPTVHEDNVADSMRHTAARYVFA